MKFIYAEYNMYHISVDITTFDGYILRIDCNMAEDGLRTTPSSECALNALAIDEPFEYARLYLDGILKSVSKFVFRSLPVPYSPVHVPQ